MTIELPIERDDVEVIATVTLYYEPASRGARDTIVRRGDGPPIEPDTESSLEVDDCDYELTELEKEEAVRLGWKQLNEEREERYLSRYEDRLPRE